MSMGPGRQPKDLAECLARAEMIGLTESDARAWHADCTAAEWCRGDGTAFDNWVRQMIIHRDSLRERLYRQGPNGNGGIGKPPTAGNLRIQLEAIQGEIERMTSETASGRVLDRESDRPRYRELLAKRRTVRTKLIDLEQ